MRAARAVILIVENDAPIRALTTRLLELERFEVVAASGVLDAIERLGTVVPDVVVIDLELPDDADAVLIETLRAGGDHAGLRFVGIAGAQQSVDHGALDVVLHKPYALQTLPRVLETLVACDDEPSERGVAIAVGDRLFVREAGESVGIVRAVGRHDYIASIRGADVVLPYRSVAAAHHGKLVVDMRVLAEESLRLMRGGG